MVTCTRSLVLEIILMFFLVMMFTEICDVAADVACPKCGILEVPYPFSTDASCGDSRYKIYCNNGNELQFIILPPDLLAVNVNTPACYSSDFSSQGLTLNEQLSFNISARNTVMLFHCSSNLLRSPLNCSASSFCRQFEGKTEGCRGTLCCHYLKDSHMTSYMIRVRAGGCTAYTSVVDIKPREPVEKWNYGVELQWLPPM